MSVLDEAVKWVSFTKSLSAARVQSGRLCKQAGTDHGEDGPLASQNPSSSKRLTDKLLFQPGYIEGPSQK